jgi:hypothetical protein
MLELPHNEMNVERIDIVGVEGLSVVAAAAEELVLASATIAIGLITFGMIISYRQESRDELEISVDGVLKVPTDRKTSKKDARRRTARNLWKQVAAERTRNADLAAALASFHDELHASNPMTPFRWAELHDQTHRDLDRFGIPVGVSIEEEDADRNRRDR